MNVTTAYERVRNIIEENIRSGKYPESAKLPTEREMCIHFGVSRITIRRAMEALSSDGLIEKQQGRGTFVRPRKIVLPLSSVYSFSENLREQNILPSTRLLSLSHIVAQPPLESILQLCPGHMICVVNRLRLADEVPFAYETSYLPSEYLGDAKGDEIAQNGLYNTMAKHAGIRPDKAVETFEAVLSPAYVTTALGRKGALCVMQLDRVASYQGKIVEYCSSFIAGDKYRFRVTLE